MDEDQVVATLGCAFFVLIFALIFGSIIAYFGVFVWAIVTMIGALSAGNWPLAWFLLAVVAVFLIAGRAR